MSDNLCYTEAYTRSVDGAVVRVDPPVAEGSGVLVVLDRTVFYPGGGGQPADRGWLRSPDGPRMWDVVGARKSGPHDIAHELAAGVAPPAVGARVTAEIDWERRHALMRTHTALHVLCGVIWHRWGKAVTGGNMEPLSARMDFELDEMSQEMGKAIEAKLNEELNKNRPVHVTFLPRREALADPDLIRTKVSLIPESVDPIRVIDIEGIDKQADGGTHVKATGEVGHVTVVKTESKGKAFKRMRIQLGS